MHFSVQINWSGDRLIKSDMIRLKVKEPCIFHVLYLPATKEIAVCLVSESGEPGKVELVDPKWYGYATEDNNPS